MRLGGMRRITGSRTFPSGGVPVRSGWNRPYEESRPPKRDRLLELECEGAVEPARPTQLVRSLTRG